MEPGAEADDTTPASSSRERVLRQVMTSLRPFLGQWGLVPSRVVTFMAGSGQGADHPPQAAPRFPSVDVLRTILRHESHDETRSMASLYFVEVLLKADAPPAVLLDFMEALFAANHDPQYPDANAGAWRVHDVIQLACAYTPLQEALHDFLAQRPGESPPVDIQGVVTRLSEQRQLAPDMSPRVLETLELEGPEPALVLLLASVYATRVDMLRHDFENWMEGVSSGEIAGGSAFWLKSVVDAIEDNGGEGFGLLVPERVFSPDTWSEVYDQLAYGRRGRVYDAEDTQSEGGESGGTLLPDFEDNERSAPERPRTSAREDYLRNTDQQAIQRRRTLEYVYGRDQGHEIPMFLEILHLEFQNTASPAPNPRADGLDDFASITLSTENNSHVQDLVDGASSNSSSIGSSSKVQLRLMRDLNRPLRMSSDGLIKLRAYQEELLYWARQGCNVAIFLPTGTGKTFVILRYMQEHLRGSGTKPVVFLAPKVKLAEQQFHRFSEFFPHATYFRCGRSTSSKAPFTELLDTVKVFVMTPQCLVEAIQRKEMQMADFSMMILDECHHTARGKHAFRNLMGIYLDVKHSPDSRPNNGVMPQVIGLSASPGVGPQGTLEIAVKHIQQLCYMMNVDKICTVKTEKNKKELQFFINEPKHQIHTCGRRKKDGFRSILEDLMRQVEDSMVQCVDMDRHLHEASKEQLRSILQGPFLDRGRPQYRHWVCNLENKLVDYSDHLDSYKSLFSMTEMLVVCQRCLTLNEDCHSQYALDYLQEQLGILEDQVPHSRYSSTERRVLDHFIRRIPELQRACNDPEDYNPKLQMLEEILLSVLEKNQEDCACMVFVRTLELTRAIQNWILTHPQLEVLNPGRITGQRKSAVDGGMKGQEISDVLLNFRAGEYKLVVCTSAAEEGLDFQACNLVVRYDYVTSMISMIQIRGRARRLDSQYCLLGGLSQGNINKEQENLAWERLMNKAVEQVQEEMDQCPNGFLESMDRWQRSDVEARAHQAKVAVEKQRRLIDTSGVYRLLCRKCHGFVCMSTDFRLLDQTCRAVVDKSFGSRWKRVETGDVKQIRHNVEKVAKVHCGADSCSYDWGILIRYKPTGRLLPVLKIESFFLVDCATREKLKKKHKWSEAPFHVPDISEDELA